MVVDLHILRSHHFNAEVKPLWSVPAEQDKFIGFWKDLSGVLNDRPEAMVAYEFMNEPVADDPEEWNVLLARVVDSLRKLGTNTCTGDRFKPLAIGHHL